jgi:hypothetical protein
LKLDASLIDATALAQPLSKSYYRHWAKKLQGRECFLILSLNHQEKKVREVFVHK